MKLSKVFAGIFGVLALVLTVAVLLLARNALNAAPVLLAQPQGAAEQAEALMDTLCRGDFSGAEQLLYGQPDLGADREPADEAGALIWAAFLDSLDYEFTGDCYATDQGVARNVTIESLDISAVTADLKDHSRTLLEQRVAQAQDVEQIYDENGNYREDFVLAVLRDAVVQVLSGDHTVLRREITLNLIYEDGQWWVLGDQALLEAISGGITG